MARTCPERSRRGLRRRLRRPKKMPKEDEHSQKQEKLASDDLPAFRVLVGFAGEGAFGFAQASSVRRS